MAVGTVERESSRWSKAEEHGSRRSPIRKVAVLGAGNMGSRIAAHLANAGVAVVLLDVAPQGPAIGDKAGIANRALQALTSAKPAAFFDPALRRLITTGNFDDDLSLLRDCDWIIEAVAENLDIKRRLLAKIAPFRRSDAIVTTNTSGLPIAQVAADMDEEFRRHWFGTHFFNPPRYMRLLEIIPSDETDRACIREVQQFAEVRLGKTVVTARDTPSFIANRIGTFAMLNALRVMQSMDFSIEEVDALTGSVLGWPKMGTFRLSDLVGLDVLAYVAQNFSERVQDERSDVKLPEFVEQMLARKWLGDKTNGGFYKKTRTPDGEEQRLGLDWKALEYRPSQRAKFPAIEMAKNAKSLAERIRLLLAGDPKKDKAADFYWQILPQLWNYAANRLGEVADNVASIDTAMRTGFNWEMGPFEMWDAAGVRATAEKMSAAGIELAPAVRQLLESGRETWYVDEAQVGGLAFPYTAGDPRAAKTTEHLTFARLTKSGAVVRKNPGASLIDLGDGVAALAFHSKMNAVGSDIASLVTNTLKPDSEAVRQFDAFVIANDGQNFSVGANLMQLLLGIQEAEWDEIDAVIRSFQKMTQTIKFCPRPVVVAPFQLCLGGGAEIALHGASRQAHAELYMGLVETGVGLIPAGGGCKEMLLRVQDAASIEQTGRADSAELGDRLRRTFECIALAKVSTSANEARSFGYLSAGDSVSMNRDRLLSDAKQRASELAAAGYRPPAPRTDIPVPGESALATLKMGVRLMREGEFISDHDVEIANRLASVLCGGTLTAGPRVSEQYLLDLERESFLSLCGQKKTLERIAHTLKTGKPLRN